MICIKLRIWRPCYDSPKQQINTLGMNKQRKLSTEGERWTLQWISHFKQYLGRKMPTIKQCSTKQYFVINFMCITSNCLDGVIVHWRLTFILSYATVFSTFYFCLQIQGLYLDVPIHIAHHIYKGPNTQPDKLNCQVTHGNLNTQKIVLITRSLLFL